MKKLFRETIVMPEGEHKNLVKLSKHEKKAKSRVIREAIAEKIIKSSILTGDKVSIQLS